MSYTHTHTHPHTHARTHARTRARAHARTHAEVELISLGGGGGGTNYCMALGCIYIYVYVYACIYMTNMYVGMVIPEPKMIGQFRDDAFSVPPITNSIASTTIPTYMCSYI